MGSPRVLRVKSWKEVQGRTCSICGKDADYKVRLTTDKSTVGEPGTCICDSCLMDRLNTPYQSAEFVGGHRLVQFFKGKGKDRGIFKSNDL